MHCDGVAFDILRCCKDDHLQRSKYSQQGKYKGEVTNTTENVQTVQINEGLQYKKTAAHSKLYLKASAKPCLRL